MPLYVENGKLIQKAGALGTSAGCCCSQGACCAPDGSCTITTAVGCQCEVGRCCGPDTVTIRDGTETYRVYREESRQACIDRGGTWRCGSFPPLSVEGYSGVPLCDNNAGTRESVFQGVGTVCSPSPCVKCCCDGNNFYVFNVGEECTGSQFPVPDPTPTITLVFEWCGLTSERVIQGGVDTYYATANVDFYVCDTTGRYGEGISSYTQATSKTIGVYIFPGNPTSECGYKQHFYVTAETIGVGYQSDGSGGFFGRENITNSELYDCYLSQCYDGSEPDISMDLIAFTTDDTCGGTGNFAPCKYSTPELTVLGAP